MRDVREKESVGFEMIWAKVSECLCMHKGLESLRPPRDIQPDAESKTAAFTSFPRPMWSQMNLLDFRQGPYDRGILFQRAGPG